MRSCKRVYLVLNRFKTQPGGFEQESLFKVRVRPKIKSTKRIKSANGFRESESKHNKLKNDQRVQN